MNSRFIKLIESWSLVEGNQNSIVDIEKWIDDLIVSTNVDIRQCSIDDSTFWFYDDFVGEILNRKRSFFQVKGIQEFVDDELVSEQPIIIQPEIGYLGIICKEIDGVLNFLMQAKIEPGNINGIQISPTIQATKSNFTKAHGGNLPNYFEYFENSSKYEVLVDQIQSEQGSRFYKKRNRNMIIYVHDDVEVLPNYKWMTLGQIKELMDRDNIVNMDTRTVLSSISFSGLNFSSEELLKIEELFTDKSLFRSIFLSEWHSSTVEIYQYINDHKMFHHSNKILVPLNHLTSWRVSDKGVVSKKPSNFEVGYYDISIDGREVQNWTQPLFKAVGKGTFGLITTVNNGVKEFLVSAKPEIGSFDSIELGPSVVFEPIHDIKNDNIVDQFFREYLDSDSVVCDVLFSEEGGRFYHEENRNVVIDVNKEMIGDLPKGYFWVTYSTLSALLKVNNCLNIQLRNLLSLLKL